VASALRPFRIEFTAKRAELILQQMEALPTPAPSPCVMELTSDDESQREMSSASRVGPFAFRQSDQTMPLQQRGRGFDVSTVDRAVKMLGFDARARGAPWRSLKFSTAWTCPPAWKSVAMSSRALIAAFWQHSIAVAHLCEFLAGSPGPCRNIPKSEAFLSGLLHDLAASAARVAAAHVRSCLPICRRQRAHRWITPAAA
jgi:hypothetical protein